MTPEAEAICLVSIYVKVEITLKTRRSRCSHSYSRVLKFSGDPFFYFHISTGGTQNFFCPLKPSVPQKLMTAFSVATLESGREKHLKGKQQYHSERAQHPSWIVLWCIQFSAMTPGSTSNSHGTKFTAADSVSKQSWEERALALMP